MEAAADLRTRDQVIAFYRCSWQGRVLWAAQGRMAIVVPSILAEAMGDEFQILIRAVKPLCWDNMRQSIRTPFLCSTAKVSKRGRVIAKCQWDDQSVPMWVVMFADINDFVCELRTLSDLVKLTDLERTSFFLMVSTWLSADMRLDPTMDPRDPDAKRLGLH